MWRSSDQEALGLDGTLLLPPQQQGTRSHDSLVHHAQLSQDNRCTLATASEIHSGFPHELQQALLSEAVQSTADHSHTQLDVDNITLLGLGGDNVLAQFHRSLTDQTGQTLPELHAALAASLGVLPVTVRTAEGRHAILLTGGLRPLNLVGPGRSGERFRSTSWLVQLQRCVTTKCFGQPQGDA